MKIQNLSEYYANLQKQIPRVAVTYINDNTLAKNFGWENGALTKTKPIFRSEYFANVIEANLIDLHIGLSENTNLTLILGYPEYKSKPVTTGEITILSEKEFTKRYPNVVPQIAPIQYPDGMWGYDLTRTKKTAKAISPNFTETAFALFDNDLGSNAPEHMKIDTTEEILDIFESVAPGCFKDVLTVEVFSSSSGLIAPDGTPLTGFLKRHLYQQVLDPADIPRFMFSLWVKLVNAGYYYFEGGTLKTFFDKQAISPERFCYEAKPILHNGVTQERRDPRLLGSKLLNTRLLPDPTNDELVQYEAIKGNGSGNSNGKKSVSIASIGQPERLNDLDWDTEIKLDNGMMTTPRIFKESGATSLPCHSPFRIDNNPSAKLGLDQKGNPFVYDAATSQTHFIVEVTLEAAIEGELVDDSTIIEEEHEAYDVYDLQSGIEFMNAKYAVVMIGGKCLTMEIEAYNSALKCNQVEFFSRLNLAEFNKEKRVLIRKTYVNLVDYWSAHKNTVRYRNIVFDPTQQQLPSDTFNLFRGLTCKPKRGSWRKFIWHILLIICDGDKKLARYVFAWMANMVQGRPKPGVAIVLIGERGTGKGQFASIFGKLFGRHFLQIVQRGQLTGNFNAHLREAYLVFADEAFWAGDKQAESALKALITEHLIMIEQKGIDAFQIANFTNFIFATNNEWSVPAGQDERRFCVLRVSSRKKQNHAYFAALEKEMLEEGGLEAMLHDLLAFDLSNVNLRIVPSTLALSEQKYHSDVVLQFIIDRIDNEFLAEDWDTSSGTGRWRRSDWGDGRVTKDNLFDSFVRFSQKSGHRNYLSKETLGKQLKTWIDNLGSSKMNRTIPGLPQLKGATCYKFPPVEECKQSVDKKLGSPWSWTPEEYEQIVPPIFESLI